MSVTILKSKDQLKLTFEPSIAWNDYNYAVQAWQYATSLDRATFTHADIERFQQLCQCLMNHDITPEFFDVVAQEWEATVTRYINNG